MKKILLTAAILGSLAFTACSSDDDSDNSQDCRLCTLELTFGGTTSTSETEICDNEDGTATVTSDGESQIVNLEEEGLTFDEFIEAFALISTCESI